MTAPELLPCPFCGSAASIGEGDALHAFHKKCGFYVTCDGPDCSEVMGLRCECDYGTSGEFETPEAAGAAWNRRAPLPPKGFVISADELIYTMRVLGYIGASVSIKNATDREALEEAKLMALRQHFRLREAIGEEIYMRLFREQEAAESAARDEPHLA